MKNKDFIGSFDKIKPDHNQRDAMLNNIISLSKQSDEQCRPKKAPIFYVKIFAPACAVLIIIGASWAPLASTIKKNKAVNDNQLALGTSNSSDTSIFNGDSSYDTGENEAGGGSESNVVNEKPSTSSMTSDVSSENAMCRVFIFELNGARYEKLNAPRKIGGSTIPVTCAKSDVGSKKGIAKSDDKSIDGCIVYEYKPLNAPAVLVLNRENEYQLFAFSSFSKYQNNSDVDANEYLKMFGINSASDISGVKLIKYGETSAISTTSINSEMDIAKFYGFYSPLINSSKEYFDILAQGEIPNNSSVETVPGGGQASPGFAGTVGNKLSDAINIEIQAKNGLMFETWYYPNIRFISRYKISSEFESFLSKIIK